MKVIYNFFNRFRSHWYYWYTGQKISAITSVAISTLIVWGSLAFIVGFSLPLVLLIVILDALGFWLVLLYLFILRPYLPEFANIQGQMDSFVIYNLLATFLVSLIANRAITYLIARRLGVLAVDRDKPLNNSNPPY